MIYPLSYHLPDLRYLTYPALVTVILGFAKFEDTTISSPFRYPKAEVEQ